VIDFPIFARVMSLVPIVFMFMANNTTRAEDLLPLIEEVAMSTASVRQGASCIGTYRHYSVNGEEHVLLREAEVTVDFAENRYITNMEFSIDDYDKLDRLVLVFDGESVACGSFSERISVTGAEGQVFQREHELSDSAAADSMGIQWDFSRLDRAAMNLSRIIENIGRDRLTTSEMDNGDILVTYQPGRQVLRGNVEMSFAKDSGYHLVSKTVKASDGTVAQQYDMQWLKVNDSWFVQSITEYSRAANAKWELTYSAIQPQKEVDDNKYSIAALDLPGGSRVLDRSATEVNSVVHFTRVSDAEIVRATGSMLEEVASLPQKVKRGASGRTEWTMIALAVNAILIAIVWWVYRTRFNSAPAKRG